MNEPAAGSLPVPARLNIALLAIASATSAGLLYFASHADSAMLVAIFAICFSFTANTLFSLLHEAVHGMFSTRHSVNEWMGRFAAAWFPTGLSIQRAFHLTHHRNNRSRLEQFDVLHDGDVVWLKYAQWYSILTGFYWFVAVFGVLMYLLVPRVLHLRFLRAGDSKVAEQTSSLAYLSVLDALDPLRARLEILFSLALHAVLFWALDLSVAGWIACYAAFAINWSSLQYVDHAFSPLDARNGAWNLKVGPIGRAFFLDYHLHLAHHRNAQVPWIHLKTLLPPDEPQPRFFRVLLESWRGPRRIEDFPGLTADADSAQAFLGIPRGIDVWVALWLTTSFVLLFAIFFGGADAIAGVIPWRFEVTLPFESSIPFVPETVFAYLALNPLLAIAPFVLRRWQDLLPLFAALVFATVVGAVFFVAFPVHTTFAERKVEGALGPIFSLADTINLDQNFFPSLHVAFAVIAAFAYAPKLAAPGRAILFAVTAAIAVSTVLIHEHHVLDVLGGLLLALLAWHTAGGWARRADVRARIDIELTCAHNMAQFGRRHVRYWLIALGLMWDSIPHWRATRVLRTGFCFLQLVDDLLDGDRPSDRDPLRVTNDVAAAISSDRYGDDELMRLAAAFVSDLRVIGGEAALADVLALIKVMQRDHRRASLRETWSAADLQEHHRETFRLSIDLMLVARKSGLRAGNVPELIDALGWCSTMRDLREDLRAGIINIPRDVLQAARAEGESSLEFDALIQTAAIRHWIALEHGRANALLDAARTRLAQYKAQSGLSALKFFERSIRGFSRRRMSCLYPFIVESPAGAA